MRPYWIRVEAGKAEGDLSCEVGHRVPLADGRIDGIYGGWSWNGRELAIHQDRYGFFPLFEWKAGDQRIVSTDLVTLLELGAPRTLDLDALSVFVRLGFFVGADTPFQAIRAVVPPVVRRPVLEIPRDEAIDGFIDLFRQSIARRLPSTPFVMPLSGGRDSRHILFELRDAGRAPSACVTVRHFPPRANDDESVAREICDELGLDHQVILQPRDRAWLERRKNVLTHLCTDEHAQFVVLAEYLRARTPQTYDGIAGDVLSQSTYLRPEVHALFRRGDTRGVAGFVLDGYGTTMSQSALERVLAPAFCRDLSRERAIARLVSEIVEHVDTPNPTGSFFLYNRTRREIALAPYALMRDLTVYAPYLDWDLFDFLAALPAERLMDKALHTDAIARAWPQHAHLAYERKGLTIEDRWAERRFAAAGLTAVLRPRSRAFMRQGTLVPPLAATLVDGSSERLWQMWLVLYLDQVAEMAVTATTVARRRER